MDSGTDRQTDGWWPKPHGEGGRKERSGRGVVAEGLEGRCGAMRPCHPLGEQQGNAAAGQMDGRVGGWTDGWMAFSCQNLEARCSGGFPPSWWLG